MSNWSSSSSEVSYDEASDASDDESDRRPVDANPVNANANSAVVGTAFHSAIPVMRGKTLRPPDTDESEDEEEEAAEAEPIRVGPPATPRGKVLRSVDGNGAEGSDDDDDDDEPIEKAAEKKSPAAKPAKKKASPRKKAVKRKDPPAASDSDSDAVAAVVVDSDDEEVAVAELAEPAAKRIKGRDGKAERPSGGGGKGEKKNETAVAASPEQLRAAAEARAKLRAVTSLPHPVDEARAVRSFGRVRPEGASGAGPLGARFSAPHAIYPAGFSADRREFSPVHGRVVRVRCEILDGSLLEPAGEGAPAPADVGLGDGPVFRVMWGEGIEADVDEETHSFDLASADVPTVGTRVGVTFDEGAVYFGKIIKVATNAKKSTKHNTVWNIGILYEDGVVEHTTWPDPDICLFPPGCPPIQQEAGWVTELHGKPVHSVLAKTPLEAWGKTLLSLGLIDEIIYEEALNTVQRSREEGLSEARDRIDAANKKRRDDRKDKRMSGRHSMDAKSDEDGAADGKSEADATDADATTNTEDESEPPSEKEIQLREKLEQLKRQLSDAKRESRAASADLARARISTISPFAANPFLSGPDATAQELSLMAAAVKKEKSKMGNTGNKRKVVTPATLMERSDTFFTQDIEKLIEGLPGSEYAPLYVFHANRSAAATGQAWVHEAKVRHQNALQKKLEREKLADEEAEAKKAKEDEIAGKKRAKEEEVAMRKRAKEEEEEQKKKERVEKRLAQLTLQMDERLLKESYFLREKGIMTYVKALTKEFARRRKSADAVVAHKLDQLLPSMSDCVSTAYPAYGKMLPPLSDRMYDEEIIRIWDFIHCFRDAFVTENSGTSLPTLDSLQDAIDVLKKGNSGNKKYSAAVALMEGIAINLCKAISPGLTKYLASSSYQVDASKGSSEESACLPVTAWTWREVARMSFIGDLLIDLGYSKNDSANIVKGYRSGGHPNSKEAKRWKKIEESPVVMLYQQLNSGNSYDEAIQYRRRLVTARLSTPCNPSCTPSDWRFFLHNIRSRTSNSAAYIQDNVKKSLLALKKNPTGISADAVENCISELERSLRILKQAPSAHSADPVLIEAKQVALNVLDSTREKFVNAQKRKMDHSTRSKEPPRRKMGLLKNYQLSRDQYRSLESAKEDYMVAALKLKEELEMKNKDDAAALSDDEEDDYEGGAQAEKPSDVAENLKSEEPVAEATNQAVTEGAAPDVTMTEATEDGPGPTAAVEDVTMTEATGDGPASTTTAQEVKQEEKIDSANSRSAESQLPAAANDSSNDSDSCKDEATTENQPGQIKPVGTPPEEKDQDESKRPESKPDNSSGSVEGAASKAVQDGSEPCGTTSDYDFCADVPTAHDLIRRCLAVARTLCSSSSAEPFIYPVDPQLYPGYYESVTSPISLYDVGNFLRDAAQRLTPNDSISEVEHIVAECGRSIRKIFQNSLSYNTGNKEHLTMNSAEEMLRLFERLFFDWVLAPSRPALQDLDDDKCIDHHVSDASSMVILCDGCEGKYNMARLKPPLVNVPSGEWYCPRCITGRCWGTVDPRIGRRVHSEAFSGTVESCKFMISEDGEYSLLYCICADDSGSKEFWMLKDVDNAIVGDPPVPPISCLSALAECSGYSFGRDTDVLGNALPLAMNPFVADSAAQSALSSTVFQDTISSCVSLMNPPEDLTSPEWIRLLMLLCQKCSSSDKITELSTNLENKEAATLASAITTFWRARGAKNIVPDNSTDDDSVSSQDEPEHGEAPDDGTAEPKTYSDVDSMKLSGVDSASAKRAQEKELHLQDSTDFSNDNKLPEVGGAPEKVEESNPVISPEEEMRRKKRETVLFAKTIRQKKREEALVGFYVQNSLKSTVASFEEDSLTSLVGSSISNQEEGLNIAAVRCRETCHFCHLSDMAICSPMVRVPSDAEWRGLFPHAVHERNSYMIAKIAQPYSSNQDVDQLSGNESNAPTSNFCIVRVRVGGELVSSKASTLDYPSKTLDQPMQQFLPRNILGFQSELKFRQESNLSVVTGSLTAHEVCAIAAHRTRKEHFLKERREHCKNTLSRDAATLCGKSIPIGQDQFGRVYWIFKAEPKCLFICETPDTISPNDNITAKKWHKFSTPQAIASVIVGLGKDPPSESLKEAYPEAVNLVKNKLWSTLLMQKSLRSVSSNAGIGVISSPGESEEEVKFGAPFVEDEDVLVESENGRFLWDAVVLDVLKDLDNGQVKAYLVRFKNWSSRFDSWVASDRVVETSPNNLLVQTEALQEFESRRAKAPVDFEGMLAMKNLQPKNFKKGNELIISDIFESACLRPGASHDERGLALLKGAVLLVEAALPSGAIEYWPKHAASLWRNFVKNAQGPESLLKCVLLLEDAISLDFMRPQSVQLLAALPRQWRAMGEASLSSVALRLAVLDHSIKYS